MRTLARSRAGSRAGLLARSLAAAGALLVLAGCGSASAPSPPAGVDGLVIPTPDPRAADFVAGLDNPWFPAAAGARWELVDPATGATALTLTTEPGPEVDGIATTRVVRTAADGTAVGDLYAQDRAGNVWWFGREGEWLAGDDGAEAGLAMPARPRRGDGFRTTSAGLAEIATVTAFDEEVTVPLATYRRTVTVEIEAASGATRTEVYARGVGPVRIGDLALAAHEPAP